MKLKDTTTTLEILLDAPVTADELDVTVAFINSFIRPFPNEVQTKVSADDGNQEAETDGTTPVTILDAPENSYKREVSFASVYNADTVAAIVTIRYSTPRTIVRCEIQSGETLVYARGHGWYVLDAEGRIKTSLSSFAANIEDAINDGVTDKAPSENAVYDALQLKADIAYVDALVQGLADYRGTFDASGGAYPSTGGSGTAGAILKADFWIIAVAGTLPTGVIVEVGDWVFAKIDTPGNTQANWDVVQYNIGFTPENVANKETADTPTDSTDKYPSSHTLIAYVDRLPWKRRIRCATTAAISVGYNADATTIEALIPSAFPDTPDGVTLAQGDTVLIKNETGASQKYNGWYVVTRIGSVLAKWLLTRISEANTDSKILQSTAIISEGTLYKDTIWTCTTDEPITIGTTALAFAQAGGSPYTASAGITLTGQNFTLDNSYFSGDISVAAGVVTIEANKITYQKTQKTIQLAVVSAFRFLTGN